MKFYVICLTVTQACRQDTADDLRVLWVVVPMLTFIVSYVGLVFPYVLIHSVVEGVRQLPVNSFVRTCLI